MKSLIVSHSRRSTRRPAAIPAAPCDLRWIHDGVRHRATTWPDVRFERELAGEWQDVELSEGALASAALGVTAVQWRRFLELVPAAEREYLQRFHFSRMAALQAIVRCPELLEELTQTPALTAFLSAHLSLRGGERPAWGEIAAVFQREGVFGLLQWLGLPASRETRTILQHIADPDLPQRLLQPLRAALWEPAAIWALSHAETLTDEQLADTCHALAA